MLKKRMLAGALALVVGLLPLYGCHEKPSETPTKESLTVGYSYVTGTFSPFFAATAGDRDVADMTQVYLLSTDRAGQVVQNGIEGETVAYNGTDYTYTGPADVTVINHDDGTVDYEFRLREDLCFSDGTPLTADDVLFSLYVLCDPTYDGPFTVASLPIRGLSAYRRGVTPKWQLILADTPKTAATGSPDGHYTSGEAVAFWTAFNAAGAAFAEEIVNWGISYHGKGETVKDIADWLGYTGLPDSATATDLFNAMVDRYGYDLSNQGINSERVKNDFEELLKAKLSSELTVGVVTGDTADTIEGIQKTGTHTLCVTLDHADRTALSAFCIPIAPLHYYGNTELLDYEVPCYGLTKGDLTAVYAKTSEPMGAGPYEFRGYRSDCVTFAANANYYRGTPQTKTVMFRKVDDATLTSSLQNGVVDLVETLYSKATATAIAKVNGGVMNGDALVIDTVDTAAYGYIGLNANGLKVGTDPYSEQSRCLRKAFATIFSAYRGASITDFFVQGATALSSPYTETASSTDYMTFSTDVNGNPLYTDDMTEDERCRAAEQAALGFLEAAGYTVSDGKVVAAPLYGKRIFEIQLAGGGTGNHPAYAMLVKAQEALERLGITLRIADRNNEGELWSGIRTGRIEMWCAEQPATETDRYALYFSGEGTRPTGAENYLLDVNDAALNRLILQAREADDEAYATLRDQCFSLVAEWAVELPLYCRGGLLIYAKTYVNVETAIADATPYYRWIREVSLLKMNT